MTRWSAQLVGQWLFGFLFSSSLHISYLSTIFSRLLPPVDCYLLLYYIREHLPFIPFPSSHEANLPTVCLGVCLLRIRPNSSVLPRLATSHIVGADRGRMFSPRHRFGCDSWSSQNSLVFGAPALFIGLAVY